MSYMSHMRGAQIWIDCLIGVREWSLFALELRDDIELQMVRSILQITGTTVIANFMC